jgi:hypothetical protein
MHIDRSNYEILFIDWLDGNLNALEVEQLKLYLDQNPGLREEFNDLAPLNPLSSGISFLNKEQLKKTPSDISPYQFEYLCAAYLENDLSDSQQAEMLEIINRYPERKKSFDLMRKTILAGESTYYKHKRHLLKRTTFQKVMQLSVIGLSTAAAISLIIIMFSVIYGTNVLKLNSSAHNFVPDSLLQRSFEVKSPDRILKYSKKVPVEEKGESSFITNKKKDNAITNNNIIVAPDNLLIRITDNQKIAVNKVPVHPPGQLVKGINSNTLVASIPKNTIPDVEGERSKAGKFLSKTIREKFLKEKTPPDTPLKGYEIAEAGVTGLNKLFGWQMVLDVNNDKNGQPSSVYFSSKILKLNAPVKKKEPQP